MKVNYPWSKTPPGGWFFVPTLTPEKTRAEGLQAAILHRIFRAEVKVGAYKGQYGVLFIRPRERTDPSTESSLA